MDVPGVCRPGVLTPADPEGLTSLEVGSESPAGPTVNVGGCLGWASTTPAMSESDIGRGDRCGDDLGERDALRD